MKENKVLYKILKVIYVVLLKVIYHPKVSGKENIPESGSLIFVGNHIHFADPIMVMSHTSRIVHYMAKESLFKGIHGYLFKKIGLIKVYRGRSNPKAVVEAVEILNAGGTVGIFPEGTRNKGADELLKFRHGAVSIAKQTGAKILPFAIKGKYKIFRKGVEIEFGKPIDISNMEVEEANDFVKNEVLKILRK